MVLQSSSPTTGEQYSLNKEITPDSVGTSAFNSTAFPVLTVLLAEKNNTNPITKTNTTEPTINIISFFSFLCNTSNKKLSNYLNLTL